jgi:hypothetical protein
VQFLTSLNLIISNIQVCDDGMLIQVCVSQFWTLFIILFFILREREREESWGVVVRDTTVWRGCN